MRILLGGGIDSALTHFTLVGLAAILKEAGAKRVRLWWEDGASAQATLDWEGPTAGEAVRQHAQRHTDPTSWVQAIAPGTEFGLFSPRRSAPSSEAAWAEYLAARESVLAGDITSLDHAMLTNLGEPGYWVIDNNRLIPDRAASRWEMKTRNRGEEFVGRRLAPLAKIVADRDEDAIEAGLRGDILEDLAGGNKVDSRTATGLTPPRPTDDAMAWCALWGISAFTLIPAKVSTSATAGAFPVGKYRPTGLVLPIITTPTSLTRWVHLLGLKYVPSSQSDDAMERFSATEALRAHGVVGTCVFPVEIVGSASAPEQRLLAGTFTPIDQDTYA